MSIYTMSIWRISWNSIWYNDNDAVNGCVYIQHNTLCNLQSMYTIHIIAFIRSYHKPLDLPRQCNIKMAECGFTVTLNIEYWVYSYIPWISYRIFIIRVTKSSYADFRLYHAMYLSPPSQSFLSGPFHSFHFISMLPLYKYSAIQYRPSKR